MFENKVLRNAFELNKRWEKFRQTQQWYCNLCFCTLFVIVSVGDPKMRSAFLVQI